jgi:hypothetical protein
MAKTRLFIDTLARQCHAHRQAGCFTLTDAATLNLKNRTYFAYCKHNLPATNVNITLSLDW